MRKRVVIVDNELCNLDSIERALRSLGADTLVTRQADDLAEADRIVLPGVGAFGVASDILRRRGIDDALRGQVARGVPLLGICLGMQLLVDSSEEGGRHRGLGLIPGRVIKFQPSAGERVPHIGWNAVLPDASHPLFRGVAPESDFYFVHSYHVVAEKPENALATTPYCGDFVSAIGWRNVLGVQFHPEKSQKIGFKLLENFLAFERC